MQGNSVAVLVAAFTAVSAVDAGVFSYSNRSLEAGITDGFTSQSATDFGFDPWFGSSDETRPGLIQFAGIGSSLSADQFTVSANVALAASTPGYADYAAFSNFALNFSLAEESFVTFFIDLGTASPEGAVILLECVGPEGVLFSYPQPSATTFVRTLAAGQYFMVGSIAIVAPSEGTLLNSGLLSVAANAVAVPAPAVVAVFGAFGLLGSRRRR